MNTNRTPSAAQFAQAKTSKPVHHPADAMFRESWSVVNPRGVDIHFMTEQDALDDAETCIY